MFSASVFLSIDVGPPNHRRPALDAKEWAVIPYVHDLVDIIKGSK